MSHKSVVEQIKHYQKDIDSRPDDADRILRCIRRLFHLNVTVQHLEETGVGKSVNALRKYGGEVAEAAKALVLKWKAMVSAEEGSENEQNGGTNNSASKENKHHSSVNNSDKRIKERDANHYNGKEKRSRESDSDHHSSSEKRLKINDTNHVSKEKRSKENDYNNHEKSNLDRHSHHKDSRRNHSHSSEKHSKNKLVERSDNHKKDKYMKEKENKDYKHHSSRTSNHSVKNHTKEKRHAVNDSEEDSDGSVKRRRRKSPSPVPSDAASDDENNVHVNGDRNSSGSEIENNDRSDQDEDEDEREEDDEEPDESEEEEEEEDDESGEEMPPNPYLNTFIKNEPVSSEDEDDAADNEVESESENRSPPASDAESEYNGQNSDNEEEYDNENCTQNSRLTAESESEDDVRHTKNVRLEKECHRSNDNFYQNKKSSHKEVDRKHEKHKLKEERHKNSYTSSSSPSSSKDKHSVTSKHSSSSANKGSSSSNHHSSSSSSKNKSSSNSNHSSSQTKHREHHKETSKVDKSSHSVSKEQVKHKSDSDKSKDDKHRRSDERNDKIKTSSSSTKSTATSQSKSSSSCKPEKVSSSSSKDKKQHKTEVNSSSHHSSSSSSSKSNSISRDGSNRSKKDAQILENDLIKREIKKEPETASSKSYKENTIKSPGVENHKNSDSKPVKMKTDIKIKTEKLSDDEDGIDGGSGASFADALLGMSGSVKKVPKKKSGSVSPKKTVTSPVVSFNKNEQQSSNIKKSKIPASNSHSSKERDNSKLDLLAKNIKLEPLEMDIASTLPEISPNYHPLPHYSPPDNSSTKRSKLSEEEALCSIMSTKNQRTKVFSGNKCTYVGSVPSLYSLCSHVILENIDALEYTGGVPYDLLKPVLERLSATQLYNVENYNPYLIEDTDVHWKFHCNKEFRGKQRDEMESWRDLYLRCLDEREQRLIALTANINQSMAQRNEPVRKTKLAYVDSFVKPPRNIAKKQAKFGTSMATPASSKHEIVSKAVVGANDGPPTRTVVPPPPAPSRSHHQSAAMLKKKKAPLMMKTLQFMKGNRFKR